MKKMNVSSSLKSTSLRKLVEVFWKFWVKYFRLFLIIFALCAIAFVVNVWYKNLYQLDQAEEDRALQLVERTKEVEFDEESFELVNERVEERRREFSKDAKDVNDIFFPDQSPQKIEGQGLDVVIEPQSVISEIVEEQAPVVDAEEVIEQETVDVSETDAEVSATDEGNDPQVDQETLVQEDETPSGDQ